METDYKDYEQERKEAELNGGRLLGNLIREKIKLSARIPHEVIEYQELYQQINKTNQV